MASDTPDTPDDEGTSAEAEAPLVLKWPLGQYTAHLAAPTALVERWAVTYAWGDAGDRGELRMLVMAGALGLCDPEIREYVRRAGTRYTDDVRVFGRAVIAYLTGLPLDRHGQPKAATMAEIISAGDTAVALCWRARVTEEAVKSVEDFTPPSSAPSSSSSSISSASGGSASGGWVPSTPETPRG